MSHVVLWELDDESTDREGKTSVIVAFRFVLEGLGSTDDDRVLFCAQTLEERISGVEIDKSLGTHVRSLWNRSYDLLNPRASLVRRHAGMLVAKYVLDSKSRIEFLDAPNDATPMELVLRLLASPSNGRILDKDRVDDLIALIVRQFPLLSNPIRTVLSESRKGGRSSE